MAQWLGVVAENCQWFIFCSHSPCWACAGRARLAATALGRGKEQQRPVDPGLVNCWLMNLVWGPSSRSFTYCLQTLQHPLRKEQLRLPNKERMVTFVPFQLQRNVLSPVFGAGCRRRQKCSLKQGSWEEPVPPC